MSSSLARENLRNRFRALQHRNFRLFWLGQLVSLVGTWMQTVAQGWLMHRLTDSALMLGLLGFAQFLPVMLFSLWAGVIADRMDKRRLIVVTQMLALLQAVVLAVLVSTATVQPWMVLVLAFAFGTISAFDLPARQSFLIEMVGKEDLSNAIALNSAAFNSARVLGPAVAGVVVAVAGEGPCFWINAASYVAVLAMLARLDTKPLIVEGAGKDALHYLTDGVRYALSVHPIRNLLLLLGVTAGLGFQYMVLLPVYAREILAAGPGGYGMMVSAFGLGSLFSAVIMTRSLDRWGLRRNLLVGLSLAGAGMLGFAWSRVLPVTLVMGFFAGFGLILYVATTNTLLQLTTDDRFRGRIMSLYTFMFIGTAPLGALASGVIAQRFSAPIATTFCAAVLLAGAVWVAYRLRVLAAREAARPTEPVVVEKVG
ncbi:MAG TPA: MFS transporter [Candidatus Limnocylindria bacterium]|nr:MFS transporter [Candidatus Limnocylindria bacterium]